MAPAFARDDLEVVEICFSIGEAATGRGSHRLGNQERLGKLSELSLLLLPVPLSLSFAFFPNRTRPRRRARPRSNPLGWLRFHGQVLS